MDTGDMTVRRWRRYGKDRLYVESAGGVKIGWWDLLTDEAHPEAEGDLDALVGAVATWKAGQAVGPLSAEEPATPDQDHHAVPAEQAPFIPGLGEQAVAAAAMPTAVIAPESSVVDRRPWIDLSTNRAGAGPRERAQSLRAAAPVKTTLARILGVRTDERSWRIGADGEELVAAQFAKVARKDSRWRFLHAIPIGVRGADIDHLVIGPGGIFTVNAKHHPRAKIWVGGNTFLVNGNRQPYIRNSRHEADRAAQILSTACEFPVHVEGLIVTVNAADVVIKSQPDGVHVTWRNNLTKWISRLGEIHDAETLEAVYEAARRSTTWRG